MKQVQEELDGVEKALLELQAAECARLFGPTRVDAGELLKSAAAAQKVGWRRRVLRWVPAAAAAAIAVAIMWSAMFEMRFGPGDVRTPSAESSGSKSANDGCDGSFIDCFTGPIRVVLADCATHDYDSDGDVDLVDFSAYQRGCRGITRNR